MNRVFIPDTALRLNRHLTSDIEQLEAEGDSLSELSAYAASQDAKVNLDRASRELREVARQMKKLRERAMSAYGFAL